MPGIKQDTSLTFSIPEAKPDIQRLLAGVHQPTTPDSADASSGDRESPDDQDMSGFIDDDSFSEEGVVTDRTPKTGNDKATTGMMPPPPVTPRTGTPTPSVARAIAGTPFDPNTASPPITPSASGPSNLHVNVERANKLITPGPAAPAGGAMLTPSTTSSNASKLKRTFTEAMGTIAASGNKLVAERDPENHEIKRLRDVEGLKWGEIADKLNKARIAAGKVPGLTDNAIYSRYTRNAPRIAANAGETWDPTVNHPKPANTEAEKFKLAPLPPFSARDDELLVIAYQEIMAETWDLVAARLHKKGGNKFDKEAVARRYQSL
ncbi:MAG: hypothetical protein M1835_008142 [Candelina submexicana]|nr:MAG: hypothetical protein M1835_008142 [Candelina submexicana]